MPSRDTVRSVDISLLGDKELTRSLNRLDFAVQKKLVKKALKPATKLFEKGAEQNVPVDTGQLKKSIKTKVIRSRRIVGWQARTGQGFFVGETFYGGFLEFGTKHIPAYEYLKGSYEEHETEARGLILTKLRELVTEALR